MRNLPASCVTAAAAGMVVHTASEAVIEARRTIIDLLLANHPQDCLTCAKNGDCRLQDYAFLYGVRQTSFPGERKNYPLDDTNPYIVRDHNKCILCGKCVRTCQAVPERSVIDFGYRGFQTKIVTAMDTDLAESDCVYCARCVAVCPVGALTYKPLEGKGRTWELAKKEVTCTFCENGCKFDLNIKDGRVVGVTAKAPGPGRPLCLKGRLGTELLYAAEPLTPMLKKEGKFVPVSWAEALGLEEILARLKQADNG
jgi:NADH dehydrogenase/NADH:ubiquinone oxidoreductase subunit G